MADDKETTPNLTDKHPALQIYETLQIIHETAQSRPGEQVSVLWMTAIGRQRSSFNSAWFEMMSLLDECEKRIQRDPNLEQLKRNLLLNIIGEIKTFIYSMNSMDGARFIREFTSNRMSNLILIPDGNLEIESPLTQKDLDSIQAQITDLMASVRNSSLPAEVKHNLLSALYDLMDVIADYELHGIAGIEKEIERYVGVLSRHNSELEGIPSEEDSISLKEKLRKFGLDIIERLAWKITNKAIEAGAGIIQQSLSSGQT